MAERVNVQAHTGPITYIAAAFDVTVDDATKWIVIMLIVVFDPLAVALTIAANIMIQERAIKQVQSLPEIVKIKSEEIKIKAIEKEPKKEEPPSPPLIEPKKETIRKKGVYEKIG